MEELRPPAVKHVASRGRENVGPMNDLTESHQGSVVESEDVNERETSDMSEEEVEAETLLCSHPMSEGTGLLVGEMEMRPIPTPRKRMEGNVRVDTPIPPLGRS